MAPDDLIPVLLDTDIGSDIDDALALAYLLRQPRCELVGVTTLTGDVAKRAALAQVLCETVGRSDIPIHCGASSPLGNGRGQPHVPQYDSVRDLLHRLDWPEETAVEFLRDAIRSRPGELTLLSIGPMTNVAQLFNAHREVTGMLKAWVSMDGEFGDVRQREAEWNCACDPLAAATATRRFARRHVHIGLNVTLDCRMPAADVRQRFKGSLLALVLRMAETWFERRSEIVFHDPLAAAALFEPDLCRYERGDAEVDGRTGRTEFTPATGGRDEVAVQVNAERFMREFFRVTRAE